MSDPTDLSEFLQRAYNRLRKPSWDGGLEEALAHPLRGPILRSLARDLRDRGSRPPPTPSPTPPVNRPRNTLKLPAILDRKRLASGEREDD